MLSTDKTMFDCSSHKTLCFDFSRLTFCSNSIEIFCELRKMKRLPLEDKKSNYVILIQNVAKGFNLTFHNFFLLLLNFQTVTSD